MRYIRINLIGFFLSLFALFVFLDARASDTVPIFQYVWGIGALGALITLTQWIASIAIRNSER